MISYKIQAIGMALTILLMLGINVHAQNIYTINGQLGKDQQGIVMLYYKVDGNNVKDSAIVKNGQFTLKGKIADPAYANLLLNPYQGKLTPEIRQSQLKRSLFLYIEGANIALKSADSLKNAKVTGSKSHADFEVIKAQRKPYIDSLDSVRLLFAAYHKAGNDSAAVRLQKMGTVLTREKNQVDSIFIQSHLNSYVAFLIWRQTIRPYVNKNTEPQFKRFSVQIQNTVEGKKIADKIVIAKRLEVGMPAPDFTLIDTLGHPVTLSSLKGKNVMVYFWQTNFINYKEFIFDMGRLNRKLQGENFVMLGVYFSNVNKGSDTMDYWKKQIVTGNMNWINVADMHGMGEHGYEISAVAKAYGLNSNAMPDVYLIGPDGKILVNHVDFINAGTAAKLSKLIGNK